MIITKEMVKDQVLDGSLSTLRYQAREHGWHNRTGPWQGHCDILIDSGKGYLHQFMFKKHPVAIGKDLTKMFYRRNFDMSVFGEENLSEDKEALVIRKIEEGDVEVLALGTTRFVLKFQGEFLCGTYIIEQFEGLWGIYKTHHTEVK